MIDRTMKPVDVVIVGFGWGGAIMAKELTEEGLQVLALERGAYRGTYPDGAYPTTLDELIYLQRFKLFQDMSASTFTFRYDVNGLALPYRQIGAFKPGTGVGGAGLHWAGQHWRMFPEELRLRSHYVGRYGAKFIPEGMTIQDFGVTFEKLEPHFDFAEKVFGTSGQAYRVKGQIVGDGNPFDADRSDAFPLPAQKVPYGLHVFMKAARELGFHPFRAPAATVSAPLCCKRPILPLPYHIVLSGASMPATRTAPSSMTMGSYASVLDHQQVADVVTFVRTAWGNRGALATAVQVAKVRKSSTPVDPQGWTAKVP